MNLRHATGFLTLLVLGLSALGGCGGGGSCDTFVVDYCARIAECDPATYAFLSGGDDTICQARFRTNCVQAVAADGVALTADKAGECGKAVRGAACDDVLRGNLPDSCTPPGTRADGASCSDALQCTSTRCTGSTTMCGTCVPRLKAGEPCQSSDQCVYGLRCKNAGASSSACAPYVALGQPCTITDLCLPSLFCNNASSASGTCVARRNVGETCARNTECDAQKKLTCDTTTKLCAAYNINYVDAGGACPNGTSVNLNLCKRDAHCSSLTGTGGATATCIAPASAGQPCNNNSLVCAAGLECTNNVCQNPPIPLACK